MGNEYDLLFYVELIDIHWKLGGMTLPFAIRSVLHQADHGHCDANLFTILSFSGLSCIQGFSEISNMHSPPKYLDKCRVSFGGVGNKTTSRLLHVLTHRRGLSPY